MDVGAYSVVIGCGLFALIYGLFLIRSVMSQSGGNERMFQIASAIQKGASAYLNRQYRMIAIVGVVVLVVLSLLLGWNVGIGFVIGAVLSGVAGYVGMNISVRANYRTAEAARKGLASALSVSFKAGAITGLLVVSLAILGITVYYMILKTVGWKPVKFLNL